MSRSPQVTGPLGSGAKLLLTVLATLGLAPGATLPGYAATYLNTNAITINDEAPASLYPSVIAVNNIPGKTITRASVVLFGFTHTFPDDVDVLLVAPDGTRSIVLSDTGGSTPISNKDLSFAPTGDLPPVDAGTIDHLSVLRPANYVNSNSLAETDDFPGPGPGVLRYEVADFDAFNGVNPTGDWKLYVVDDVQDDVGAIAGGWLLDLTVADEFTVTKVADTDDGVCDADCSLREAIAAATAAAGSGHLIRFASPLFDSGQTITLDGTQLAVVENMSIRGPGAAKLTISGNDVSRVFITNPEVALSLSDMTITGGSADVNGGGGIYSQGPLSLRNLTVSGNRAAGAYGGGLIQLIGSANIVGCTFSDNHALGSAAIEFQLIGGSATLRIANSTLSGNAADTEIGGVDVFNPAAGLASVEIVDSTIADNRAPTHGGILLYTQSSLDARVDLTLRNTILANNQPTNLTQGSVGGGPITATSRGYSLTNDAVNAAFGAPSDKLGADPRLGPLHNIGGQVETRALLDGSAALDVGERSGYARDQRGMARSFDTPGSGPSANGDNSDIGAVEMQSVIVTNAASSGAGSLRDAITIANANADQNDILFDDSLFGVVPQTIQLAGVLPDIDSNLSVNGPGAQLLTVRRDTGGDYRIFNSPTGARELAMSGLTISNGRAPSSGGGIQSFSRLSLAEVAVSGNSDLGGIGGGGIALVFNDGTIKHSTISGNNAAASAGGLFFQGFDDYLRVINTTISGNQAGVDSAGMLAGAQDPGASRVDVVNSTIADNTAPSAGGLYAYTQGVPATTMTVYLRNSIVANNTAPNLIATNAGGSSDIVSLGYNLSNDPTPVYLDLASDKFNLNPQLGPLANYGGPTRTHALLPNSPALDAGDWSGSVADQRGLSRPNDLPTIANAFGNAGFDMGAYEAQELSPPPTAAATADIVTVAGGTSYTFTVTYSDDDAVDIATLGNGDVNVTGPAGFNVAATFIGVDVAGNGTPRVATYSITPPGGSWGLSDNGAYDVMMQASQVADVPGTFVAAGDIGGFTVDIPAPNPPPTAVATAAGVSTAGGTSYTFTVTYTDDTAINAATLGNGDVNVTGPSGFNAAATFIGVNVAGNGTPRVATYSITPPGGNWDLSDNGAYDVIMQASQVSDVPGAFVAAGDIGGFTVNIPAPNPPPTALATAAGVTTAGGTSYTFTVTYSDDSAINISTLGNGDVNVTGPSGFNVAASFISVDVASNGTPRVATYSITPPGGSWGLSDNGAYDVLMQSSQVADVPGAFVTAGDIGGFTVAIPNGEDIIFQHGFETP